MQHYEGIIIGGGFAGAAAAYFLATSGCSRLLVLEREESPGTQASGKNAAMARQFSLDPQIQRMAIEGVRFLYDPPAQVANRSLIKPNGSLIFFAETQTSEIEKILHQSQGRGLGSTLIRRAEWETRIPLLKEFDAGRALWTPTDGPVDIHNYLTGLLRAAQQNGVQVLTKAKVEKIERLDQEFVVQTSAGTFSASFVVNAAGAWADQIAELAGARRRNLTALRRHLFVTDTMPQVDPNWPFVWDDQHGFYFRPESGGLLLCPCDEEPVDPDDTAIDPRASQWLAEKLARHCPNLAEVRIARQWSGLRTFAPDRRFVIGWDDETHGFFWIAGLGGHGVTCAAAVGRRAAELIVKNSRRSSVVSNC